MRLLEAIKAIRERLCRAEMLSVIAPSTAELTACGRGLCQVHERSAHVRLGSCVTSNAGPHGGCVTVREMKEGPSGSAISSLIPRHCKLLSSKAMVVNAAEKPGR
jgi:hypothetical protein